MFERWSRKCLHCIITTSYAIRLRASLAGQGSLCLLAVALGLCGSHHINSLEILHALDQVAVAERLLVGPGAGWAARVFFSDDGSTAVEVALKMAFRKFAADHAGVRAVLGRDDAPELQVLGLLDRLLLLR